MLGIFFFTSKMIFVLSFQSQVKLERLTISRKYLKTRYSFGSLVLFLFFLRFFFFLTYFFLELFPFFYDSTLRHTHISHFSNILQFREEISTLADATHAKNIM